MTSGALVNGFSQPQPQPNQLSNSVIQTGRVIQSVMEYNSQLPVASTTLATKVEKVYKMVENYNYGVYCKLKFGFCDFARKNFDL